MVRNCRLEVSYFETQSVLIDVVLVRADTGRAARHHLVSLGTPWQQRAPLGTSSWCHPVPGGTPKVPIICTSWHDLVVCRLDLILDVPLSYRTPVVVCLLEQPVKKGHSYLYEILLQECKNGKDFCHFQHFAIKGRITKKNSVFVVAVILLSIICLINTLHDPHWVLWWAPRWRSRCSDATSPCCPRRSGSCWPCRCCGGTPPCRGQRGRRTGTVASPPA